MVFGPVIEFLEYPPALISAGHDGLFPYEIHPLDEIYIIAYRWSENPQEQTVDIWLPDKREITIGNIEGVKESVRVHKSGFLWHDRTREIKYSYSDKWLSVLGFTSNDPRGVNGDTEPVFAVLPGSPMQDNIDELLTSKAWRDVKDFHTRHRNWMQNKRKTMIQHVDAVRYERDATLIAELKRRRGAECQICGFTFTKNDGSDYCEIHHLESLADGGYDVASNCLVLCANCHRRFHYGNVSVVVHTDSNLVVEIDGVNFSCVVGY